MAKSLQEQLLQSGAAKPKQAKKARREKTRRDQQARRNAETPAADQELAEHVSAAEAAKRAQDRRLNAQQKARREAAERDQAAAQIITHNRIEPADNGDVTYNYTVAGRIKRIAVSDAQRRDLAAGRLAIVRHRDQSVLVSAAIAERLEALIPGHVWRTDPKDESPDPNDPYADFPVPDDLMW